LKRCSSSAAVSHPPARRDTRSRNVLQSVLTVFAGKKQFLDKLIDSLLEGLKNVMVLAVVT
jgi:hypothetical protein